MNRGLRVCITAGLMAALAGCRTPAPKETAEITLTESEVRALQALTDTVEDHRARVAAADDHLATLLAGGAKQSAIQTARSHLERESRVLDALEGRWNRERDELIRRR